MPLADVGSASKTSDRVRPLDRRIRRAVYEAFRDTGLRPELNAIAGRLGVPAAAVEAGLVCRKVFWSLGAFSTAEKQTLFAEVGLTGDFWDLSREAKCEPGAGNRET